MWCVMDASGQPLLSGGYLAHVDTHVFAWHEASTEPPPTSGTALLLEQSTSLIEFDPGKRRSTAINAFLDSVTAPDTVSVASYHGTPQAPVLTTYGAFTSDGALFRDDVNALSDDDASLNPMYAVLADMLSWTATQATSGPDDPRSVVLVSGHYWSWSDDDCGNSWTCRHSSRLAVAATSRSAWYPHRGDRRRRAGRRHRRAQRRPGRRGRGPGAVRRGPGKPEVDCCATSRLQPCPLRA
jgi:hypothetical protein